MSNMASNPPANMAASTYRPNFIGSVKDEWELYSDNSEDYTIGSPIGFGASSIVYAAKFHVKSSKRTTRCALKVVDLERLPPHALSLLQRETALMSLSKHPNVLRVRGSWMDGHKLYISLRLMNRGSAADVMRYGWPGGMDEDVVRCILQQALQGLNYLHINGFIHRDIKAANLLIDDDGTVLLGDLGVSANLAEPSDTHTLSSSRPKPHTRTSSAILTKPTDNGTHSSVGSGKRVVIVDPGHPNANKPRIGKRKSFVGTPCWMAPELIQGHQYDSSADIWSFGITALELTQGRPPRSRDPPQKVLIRTIQDEPPSLNREGGTYKYSKAFKDMVDMCLVKDPSKRPTAEQLLQTPFFKASKKKSYLVGAILKDLPPLTQRQERRAALSVHLRTVDSWDFTTTVAESDNACHRRRLIETGSPAVRVFNMDNENDPSSPLDEDSDDDPPNLDHPDAPSSETGSTSYDSSSPLAAASTSLSSRSSSGSLSTPLTSESNSPAVSSQINKHFQTTDNITPTATPLPIKAAPEPQNTGTESYLPRISSSAPSSHIKSPVPQSHIYVSDRQRQRPSTATSVCLPSAPAPDIDSSGSFWRKLTKRDSKPFLQRVKSSDDTSAGASSTGTIRGKKAMKAGSLRLLARAGSHLSAATK